ncbi:MAG: EAL domain-containing protein [Rubrivivax sp.]|nr:EAL domain-containing protein [Rubrivivax sp.]
MRNTRSGAAPVAPCEHEAIALRAFARLQMPIWIFDIDRSRIHWANAPALQVWRASSLPELCARDMGRDMSASVATRLAQYQADFQCGDATFNEQWTIYPGGKPVPLHVHYSGWALPDGRMAMLCQGERVGTQSPESLRSVEALLHTPMMIALYTLEGAPLWRNPASRSSVRDARETLSQRFVQEQAWQQLAAALAHAGEATLTMAVHTSAGQSWHEVSARRRLDAVTGEAALLVSETDVTPLKQSEAQALYLSDHDSLTDLPNRAYAQRAFERLAMQVAQSPAAQPLQAAVVIIDLDHFKDINDSWGHAAGDQLLQQVAQRLRGAVRHGDIVARFGGDEFIVLLCAPQVRDEIAHIHLRLREALSQPYALEGRQARVTATVGASVLPDHGSDFATLLQHADLAMYRAKAAGRDSLSFYQPGSTEQLRARTELEDDLRQALARREFMLFYQPRVGSGRTDGAEALVRWRHPVRGLVMPGDFIPVLESMGRMRELGRQVLEMAARQQVAWRGAGWPLQLSINLSSSEFEDPALVDELQQTLARTGCAAAALELEITESMLLADDDRPLATLRALRGLGVSIALDDFGTGYSNLAYLQRFPFSTLKIDRRFVQAPGHERVLTAAIVSLCRALKLRPVAEGVETAEQHRWLRSLGIQEFQGYHFARPLDVAAFEDYLRAG